MPSIKHEGKLRQLKEKYENMGFLCKKGCPLYDPQLHNFALIDLCCFRQDGESLALEIEQSGKGVLKNASDLLRFKRIFKGRVCQLTPEQHEEQSCDDFK